MGFTKCFDAVTMVTDEATKQFGSLLRENDGRKSFIKDCCRLMDSVAEEFGGISYEVEVNDKTAEITISLVCDEFETTSSGEFCELMHRAKSASFKYYSQDKIQLDFVFGGIWERTV